MQLVGCWWQSIGNGNPQIVDGYDGQTIIALNETNGLNWNYTALMCWNQTYIDLSLSRCMKSIRQMRDRNKMFLQLDYHINIMYYLFCRLEDMKSTESFSVLILVLLVIYKNFWECVVIFFWLVEVQFDEIWLHY